MKLLIASQKKAEYISTFLDEKTSIISIVCPGEDDVVFADNKNIDKIFRMYFNDLITDYELYGLTYNAPVQSDFNGLKDFVDNLDCELLLVHCGAGVSRSAAVAAAINDYLDLGYKIFDNTNYCPNSTVYSCCLKELGISKDQQFYESLFNNMENDIEIEI